MAWTKWDEFRYTWRFRFRNTVLGDLWWKFKWKFIPEHQYNKLHTGLPLGYYDPETQILYAVMNSMKHFMEYAAPQYSWGEEDLSAAYDDPAHQAAHQRNREEDKQAKRDLDEIYDWWVNRYLRITDAHEQMSVTQYRKHWRKIKDLEETLEQEANEMLCKLMKHRRHLVYP